MLGDAGGAATAGATKRGGLVVPGRRQHAEGRRLQKLAGVSGGRGGGRVRPPRSVVASEPGWRAGREPLAPLQLKTRDVWRYETCFGEPREPPDTEPRSACTGTCRETGVS